MRVGDDLFDQPVTSVRRGIGEPIIEGAFFGVLDLMHQIAALLMAKCLAVANEELEIARVGTIDIGVIDFVDDTMAQGEPDAATGMVSGADALFGAARPSRLDAGSAESNGIGRGSHQGIMDNN